ncbi:MAG: GNAT family N-acetyltransferase [Clostridia bacterium]|nr:GNAT family N-acetyltransferase [Clostridia bacterium]
MLSPSLNTERLILRRYRESDIDVIYEIITDERLTQYIKFPSLTKGEELECIRKWINEADISKYERWVIERKEDGVIVGTISVNIVVKKHNYCNVGYTIRFDYWGNGYATEALREVSDYLLENRGYYLIECSCNELNIQSSKVLLKAGFLKDGYIANRRLNKDGSYSGVEYYSKRRKANIN